MKFLNAFLAAVIAGGMLLAGCGGGGGNALPASSGGGVGGSGSDRGQATFTITIPPKSPSAKLRHTKYISSGTQSAVISITSVNGGAVPSWFTPVATNMTPGSSNCSGSPLVCTLSASVPAGTDVYAITLYSGTNGGGSALSTNSGSASVPAAGSVAVNLTLDGIPASVVMTYGAWNAPYGPFQFVTANNPLNIAVKDASGAQIIGTDPFSTPVTITDSDSTLISALKLNGTTKAQSVVLSSPADTVVLKYTGASDTGTNPTSATITASVPGSLAFTPLKGGSVVAQYTLPVVGAGSGGYYISSCSDGNLWFVAQAGNYVGRMTPTGTFTTWTIPTTSSTPVGVACGPDGRIWFTENTAGKIGALNYSTGVISEYADTNPAGAQPQGIVAGPDGNLWFGDFVGQVGKMTTSGTMATQSGSSCGSGGSDSAIYTIIVGPDSNLWFTNGSSNCHSIGNYTTGGTYNGPYTTAAANALPFGIASGGDGNLWASERGDGMVAKITTSGTVTEYALPHPTYTPGGIAAGADGALWVAENITGGGIVRVTTASTPAMTVYPTTFGGVTPIPRFGVTGPDGYLYFTSNLTIEKIVP